MPVGKEQFDADLAALKTGMETYIAAVNAFIALPPVVDLAAEDDSVKAAMDEITTAQGQIPPPPPAPGT